MCTARRGRHTSLIGLSQSETPPRRLRSDSPLWSNQVEDDRQALEQRIGMLHADAVNVAGYRAADVERNIGAQLGRLRRSSPPIAQDGKSAFWSIGLLLAACYCRRCRM